jgi:S-adenosylmethionine-diacylglycerol 3-amino-3-carboxypropyl transferase
LSTCGTKITKASFSNIFEYTSNDEFEQVCRRLSGRKLRTVFWNLLNNQGADLIADEERVAVNNIQPSLHSCFYFKNVLSLEFHPVSFTKPIATF